MVLRTTPDFRAYLARLPAYVQRLAHRNFQVLKEDPRYPSLQFKKVGPYWSVRVGRSYRALAVQDGEDFIWVWIGSHEEYQRLVSS
ncbi:MAG: hypothetical protein OXN21_14090 [Chloroflexota bacterium]|nr:hypothetical protein [Chloroflexota bacterium]